MTHTLSRPPSVGVELLSLVAALPIEDLPVNAAFVKIIILISKRLSILFCAVPRRIIENKTPQNVRMHERVFLACWK